MTEEPSRIYASARLVTAEEFGAAHSIDYLNALMDIGIYRPTIHEIQWHIKMLCDLSNSGFIQLVQVPGPDGNDYTLRLSDPLSRPPNSEHMSFLYPSPDCAYNSSYSAETPSTGAWITIEPHHKKNWRVPFSNLKFKFNMEPPGHASSLFNKTVGDPGDKFIGGRQLGLIPRIQQVCAPGASRVFPTNHVVWETPNGFMLASFRDGRIMSSSSKDLLQYHEHDIASYFQELITKMREDLLFPLVKMDACLKDPAYDLMINTTKVLAGVRGWVCFIDNKGKLYDHGTGLDDLTRLILDKVVEMPLEGLLEYL